MRCIKSAAILKCNPSCCNFIAKVKQINIASGYNYTVPSNNTVYTKTRKIIHSEMKSSLLKNPGIFKKTTFFIFFYLRRLL